MLQEKLDYLKNTLEMIWKPPQFLGFKPKIATYEHTEKKRTIGAAVIRMYSMKWYLGITLMILEECKTMAPLVTLKEALIKAWDCGIPKCEIDLQREIIEALYDDQTEMAPTMGCIIQTILRLIQLKSNVQINHVAKEVNLVPVCSPP